MKESISIPVNVIIRPRGGDFYYNENSVRSAIPFQHSGVVIGCLTKDGQVDMEKNRRLIEAARPLRFLFFSIVM